MTSDVELERFGRALVELVRDKVIVECDRLAEGSETAGSGEPWHSVLTSDEARRSIHALVPEIVDQVLFELLDAADNGVLSLAWVGADGECRPLEDLGVGEMAGWLVGSPGWRHRYSKQRFFDHYQDLRLDLEDVESIDGRDEPLAGWGIEIDGDEPGTAADDAPEAYVP
jgi:hypothetical protein